MKLLNIFTSAIEHSDRLLWLYETLLTRNERDVRSEWTDRFFNAKLVEWPRRDGIWRSRNANILMVGKRNAKLSHVSFSAASLSIFLRMSLVIAMAAIDKILHETLSLRFTSLAQNGDLDDLVKIDLSRAYEIAHSARVRKGKGGKTKSRPGHKLKAETLRIIYEQTYLAGHRIEQICALCGKRQIFKQFADSISLSAAQTKQRWNYLYIRRNQIAHECDIIRKAHAQKIHLHSVKPSDIISDINFIKKFGIFLVRQLEAC